jgi:hypothetical protein
LDPLHSGHAAPGDEQVFDVALDRATEFLPILADTQMPVSWDMDDVRNQDHSPERSASGTEAQLEEDDTEPGAFDDIRLLVSRAYPTRLRD